MFEKLSLRTQLTLSFSLLLILLCILVGISINSQLKSQQNIESFSALANATNISSNLQANMLSTRLNAIKYIDADSPEILIEYEQRLQNTIDFLNLASAEITSPDRVARIKEAEALISQYKTSFESVVALIQQRHQIVNSQLIPSGQSMRIALTQLIDYGYEQGKYELSRAGSKNLESLLLGRLYANRFLVSNTSDDLKRAQQELSNINIAEITRLIEQNASENSRSLSANFARHYQEYVRALDSVSSVIGTRNDLINNTLNVIGPTFASNLEDLKYSVIREQENLGVYTRDYTAKSVTLAAVFGLISIIIGGAASFLLPALIRKPIGGEPHDISRITSSIAQGDLTQRFDNTDKATGIYKAIVNMSSNLQTLIRQIVTAVQSLSVASNNSKEIAKVTSQAASEQKERTELLAAAITEMVYSTQQVVDLSTQSEQSAKDAQVQIDSGKLIVQKTVESIGILASQMNSSIDMVKSLEQRSIEIGSVIEVIKNISEQTNLLALNAAIEAARAGDLGRGFAVVADEVRTLAQRTQTSTTEIQTTISALQLGITSVVHSMEECGKETQETVKQSDATNTLLETMLTAIGSITDMSHQVKVAAEEQSTVTRDLNVNVTAIATSSDKTALAANDTANAAQEMATLSEGLRKAIIGFKVA